MYIDQESDQRMHCSVWLSNEPLHRSVQGMRGRKKEKKRTENVYINLCIYIYCTWYLRDLSVAWCDKGDKVENNVSSLLLVRKASILLHSAELPKFIVGNEYKCIFFPKSAARPSFVKSLRSDDQILKPCFK